MENPTHNDQHYVFVYGSLREGESNNYIVSYSKHLGEKVTKDSYILLSLGAFPGLVDTSVKRLQEHKKTLQKHTAKVKGDLYKVNSATLRSLDQLESNGSFYQRKLINLKDFNKPVWCYFLLEPLNYLMSYYLASTKDGVYDWKTKSLVKP